jgi:hypothetical protein
MVFLQPTTLGIACLTWVKKDTNKYVNSYIYINGNIGSKKVDWVDILKSKHLSDGLTIIRF